MNTKQIDEIIKNAGYKIQLFNDKEALFRLRRLVHSAYRIGARDGFNDCRKIMQNGWDDSPQVCIHCKSAFIPLNHNDQSLHGGKGWLCDPCMVEREAALCVKVSEEKSCEELAPEDSTAPVVGHPKAN